MSSLSVIFLRSLLELDPSSKHLQGSAPYVCHGTYPGHGCIAICKVPRCSMVPGLELEGLYSQRGRQSPPKKFLQGSCPTSFPLVLCQDCQEIHCTWVGSLGKLPPFSYSCSPPPWPPSLILCFNAAAARIRALLLPSNYTTRFRDSCYGLKVLPPDLLHIRAIKPNGDF